MNSTTNAWFLTERGITFRDGYEDIDGAVASFELAREIDPQESTAFEQLARTYAEYLNDYDLALEVINQAIELNPDYYWFFTFRAEIHQQMGNLESAEADLVTAIEEKVGVCTAGCVTGIAEPTVVEVTDALAG